jgi:putative phage-type endonuclease
MSEELIQGSPDWHAARCGSLGASSIADALAKPRKPGEGLRANTMARLIAERLTGIPQDTYKSQAMLDGTEREPEARAAYQFERGVLVRRVGLFKHPTINGAHASPDSCVGDDGLLEIKCPIHATHLRTLLGAPEHEEYERQVMWQMACTGRKWVDFVSYHPAFPDNMKLHITRIERNDKLITELEAQVREFLHELQMKLVELTARYGAPQRAAA